MDEAKIRTLLAQVKTPDGSKDIVAAGWIGEIEIDGGEVTVVLSFDGLDRDARHEIEDRVLSTLTGAEGIEEVLIEVEVADLPTPPPAPAAPEPGLSVHGATTVKPPKDALSEVKHLVAVASGKGGVGKSTVAVNLALALKSKGARVGICDIDIYGPSVPIQLGVAKAKPGITEDNKRFLPVEAYGLKVMSIGFLVDDDTPVIWRGPIVSSIVKQFLQDVEWGALDYLILDMPPGTGDAQLTLSQATQLTGAVIVTTPSELALVDAVKGLQMFRKVDTPVLGMVENMSHYVCESCGHQAALFNEGGTDRIAAQFGVKMLASIPIDMKIQRGGDEGAPVVAADPESPQSAGFMTLAAAILEKLPFDAQPEKKKGLLKSIFGR